ncbi:tail terminator [Vibrio phage vB_VpaS_MAR10]|uniref:Tail protein n=1 Tax=Vibrio phage vB_VpaS_MAR10 TaxID=1229755 RepID=K7RVL3_9CAUD|nr:tail terminator [Vibrio phage vB_VpaS_MAR10]AFV81270.1 hypothetical protein MAR10_037 [Vibrio phage vB_VpaS_MAR10]
MRDDKAREVIGEALVAGLKAAGITIDIAQEGYPYKGAANKPYLEVSFSVESTSSQSLGDAGNRSFVRDGVFHVNVYTPFTAGSSAMTAHIYALAVRDIFEGKHFDKDLWFWECKASPAGSNGNYNVAYANCAFRFQEIK